MTHMKMPFGLTWRPMLMIFYPVEVLCLQELDVRFQCQASS